MSALRALALCLCLPFAVSNPVPPEFFSNHTNNWAVIVDTSRFWFNYRHAANALTTYRTVKRLGIPDSHIILMIADDIACNPRNSYAGEIFSDTRHSINLYGDNIEVDYRGNEVTVESFLRVLLNRHDPLVPRSKRLLSDSDSNILIMLTGHGGEDFLKFQDAEEILSKDIADAFAQMHMKKRYNEILFLADTCQAASLFSELYSPGIIGMASSKTGQSSYSHSLDRNIGVSIIDRFAYHTGAFFEQIDMASTRTIQDLHHAFTPLHMMSDVVLCTDLFQRAPMDQVLLTDFFGSVMKVNLMEREYGGLMGDSGGDGSGAVDGAGGDERSTTDIVPDDQCVLNCTRGAHDVDAHPEEGQEAPRAPIRRRYKGGTTDVPLEGWFRHYAKRLNFVRRLAMYMLGRQVDDDRNQTKASLRPGISEVKREKRRRLAARELARSQAVDERPPQPPGAMPSQNEPLLYGSLMLAGAVVVTSVFGGVLGRRIDMRTMAS